METNTNARFRLTVLAVTAAMAIAAATTLATCAWAGTQEPPNARGRYLVRIGGCNDCHTGSYMEKTGAVPEQEWLTGDALGWRGPWGTT